MNLTNGPDANFFFELDTGSSSSSDFANRQLEWIYRVFAEPTVGPLNFSTIIESARIDVNTEAGLYTNLQSRDSEIGVQLLDNRKSALRDLIQVYRQGLTKRVRDLALSRSRMEALEKINASEPNPKLRYGQNVFEDLKAQMAADTREIGYLQHWRASIDALDHVLQAFEESGRASRNDEQMMRLVGQSLRGQLRLRAFAQHFKTAPSERLPELPPYKFNEHVSGFLLALPKQEPIVIEARTAAYLRQLVESIARLAELSKEFLQNRVYVPENSWTPLASLLRAITEFFYYCNFELPYFYTNLSVDAENTRQVWSLAAGATDWQASNEDIHNSRFLKRISLETALLIIENNSLLKCHTRDELNRFLKLSAASDKATAGPALYPYYCAGLADFDFNATNQKFKFHTAFAAIGAVLTQMIVKQPGCERLMSSPLGGPLETVLGLAELDTRAFGLEGEVKALQGLERFRLLANFWNKMGRWRAISMLGDEYAKKVTKGMEALGQPGPEHPTFLSIVLKPTMTSLSLSKGETVTDPFSALVIADQIRLMEMINVTWNIVGDFIDRLKDVHSQGKLKRILESLPQFAAEPRSELEKRFNPKWLQAQGWLWSLMRSAAPSLWDFWSRLSQEDLWTKYLSGQPLMALSQLLKLFCELSRLILLVEASGSGITERLMVNAETASQTIIGGVHGYLEGNTMPAALAETVNYYFDPEVRFDSWLAFATSFHAYLRQTVADLRTMDASDIHINGVASLIYQLEVLYPSIATADQADVAEITITPPVMRTPEIMGALTEADADLFSRVFFELLTLTENDIMMFLKLLSMLTRKETQEFIYAVDSIHPVITQLLPEQPQRLMLFNYPSTTRTFFNFLKSLEGSGEGELSSSLKTQAQDYFTQLKDFAQSLNQLTERLPHIIPSDRAVIDEFIKATTPANRDLPFLMMFAGDQLVMDICNSSADRFYQVESAMGKLRAYLREQLGGQFEEPSIELFPFGGGRIACRDNQFFLTGHNESFELAFADPDMAMSNYLLSKVASIKFSFAAQLLRAEFPAFRFIAQV